MNKFILFVIAFLCVWKLDAQVLYPDVVSSFGGYAQNSQAQLTFTAGETFYETISNNTLILTQGFNQVVIITTKIEELKNEYLNKIFVYPNPTSNFLNISINSEIREKINVNIFNIQGSLLFTSENIANNNTVDFSNFQSGVYFVQFSNKNKQIMTYKIIKK